uniref:Cell density regulated protein RA3 n=1 Tax=Mus musculus TaxID=10090 RepID=Q920F4_MOUSE|nr:cell density regulated protein RA3 [Mus musculus]
MDQEGPGFTFYFCQGRQSCVCFVQSRVSLLALAGLILHSSPASSS